MKVYLDHAATTPLDKRVLKEMTPFLRETGVFANPSSLHFYGRKAMCALDGARDKIAEILGADSSEVYFTASGSEADNWALKGVAGGLRLNGNCGKILVSAIEHHAVLNSAKALLRDGYDVEFLPVTSDGLLDLAVLREKVSNHKVSLVCVMTANNEIGTVQPIAEIARIAHGAGAYLFTDAVQAAGCMDIGVRALNADAVSFSAHKFYGPRGMGGLYVRKGVPLLPLIDGGEQERGLRGGTSNVAGAVGTAAALQIAVSEREEYCARVGGLRDYFVKRTLDEIAGVRLNGSYKVGERLPGNANLSFDGVDGTALLRRLDLKGIAASAGSACASGSIGASHVLTALGADEPRAKSALRFTFGKDNTEEQIEYTVKTLKSVLRILR